MIDKLKRIIKSNEWIFFIRLNIISQITNAKEQSNKEEKTKFKFILKITPKE